MDSDLTLRNSGHLPAKNFFAPLSEFNCKQTNNDNNNNNDSKNNSGFNV